MKRALAAAVALAAVACGPPVLKLPAGPGMPVAATDAESALSLATTQCLRLQSLTAEIAVTGTVGGRRLRGRLLVGVSESRDAARIEAVAPFGAPFFTFVATGNDSTLLLPRDGRVLEHGRPDAVLNAVAGIPLDVDDLRAVLSGCVRGDEFERLKARASGFGETWMVLGPPDASQVYLRRASTNDVWRPAVIERGSRVSALRWRAEYGDRQSDGIPRTLRLVSVDTTSSVGRAFDLRLALSQIETSVSILGSEVFAVTVPPTAKPMTLDELKRTGAFGGQ